MTAPDPNTPPPADKMKLPDMASFMDLVCWHLNVGPGKVPCQSVLALGREDLARIERVRAFLHQIEPHADDIRRLIVKAKQHA